MIFFFFFFFLISDPNQCELYAVTPEIFVHIARFMMSSLSGCIFIKNSLLNWGQPLKEFRSLF